MAAVSRMVGVSSLGRGEVATVDGRVGILPHGGEQGNVEQERRLVHGTQHRHQHLHLIRVSSRVA